jgi:hypothetical protein
MRKRFAPVVALFLVFAWFVSGIHLRATWDKGFDFRASSGYVTDPANCTYVLDTDSYPTTRNSVTFGWTVAPTSSRDRNSGFDPRIAGINFGNGNGTFQVDLPSAGTYDLSLAMGDSANQSGMTFTVKDNGSTVASYGPLNTSGADFYDATSTLYVFSAWPGSQAPVNLTFSSTVFQFLLGSATSNSTIAHIFLSQTSSGGGGSTAPLLPLLGAGPGQ